MDRAGQISDRDTNCSSQIQKQIHDFLPHISLRRGYLLEIQREVQCSVQGTDTPTAFSVSFERCIAKLWVSVLNILNKQAIGDILALNKIARNLHRRRFEDGALRLDKVKLGFSLDDEGNPDACCIQGTSSFERHRFALSYLWRVDAACTAASLKSSVIFLCQLTIGFARPSKHRSEKVS